MLITSLAFAQVKTVSRSSITFQIKNFGINTQGAIGGLKADITFNPSDLAASSIEATADVNTLDTDNSSRDEHLKGEGFFDVAHFSKITLKSGSFKHKSGNNYTGQFNLTIKDKTKPVSVPFSYTESASGGVFKGAFKIKRSDYGIGTSTLTLADEVNISVNVETSK